MKQIYLDETGDMYEESIWDVEPEEPDPLDAFFADGTITEVLGQFKSGKEGTVYLCRANPSTGEELLAAKVYRAREHRAFRNDAIYSEGRSFGKRRENLAVKNKSRLGREIQQGAWLGHEWVTLQALSAAGADVPRPIARSDSAILMQLVGDETGAAPKLSGVHLETHQARRLFSRLMENIELFLRCNFIHGDLSPYNILYWNEKLTIIDFPQSVDPRSNSNAFDLLHRDIDHVCVHFMRYGMRLDPYRMTQHLWSKFLHMDL
jgi:RIO kinase 1